ncbi:MAG: hypothetical protein PUB49_04220, partial [Selenomonadaceae bacterium]|nr:hypothetical protein [Selenomonadaceae bacterium]
EQKTIFRPSGILRSKFLYFALKIRYRHPEKAKGLCISDFSLMQQPLLFLSAFSCGGELLYGRMIGKL